MPDDKDLAVIGGAAIGVLGGAAVAGLLYLLLGPRCQVCNTLLLPREQICPKCGHIREER